MTTRIVALILNEGAHNERATTALRLAERILARGHRVTVFAHDSAASLSAGTGELPAAVAALLRRGVHGGTLDWVVEADAAEAMGITGCQAPGVVPGDHADLWTFVREADIVLSLGTVGWGTGVAQLPPARAAGGTA
ncbi:MAG: DsrE family protein [Egibacteraceae bacterium]